MILKSLPHANIYASYKTKSLQNRLARAAKTMQKYIRRYQIEKDERTRASYTWHLCPTLVSICRGEEIISRCSTRFSTTVSSPIENVQTEIN